MTTLLTAAEQGAVTTAALLVEQLAEIVADGPSRDADLADAVHHIHAVQRMLLAQAAARAYPDRYRLLGDTLRSSPPAWWVKPAEPDTEDVTERERGA